MLANTNTNAPPYWAGPLPYNTETLLEDVSKQMAAANLTRRLSRGSNGSRGGSMRIVKTTSAGISPRNTTTLGRRKTLMSDSPYRRRPMMMDANGMAMAASSGPHDRMQPPPMPNRPVSWHATSHLAPQSSCQMAHVYHQARLDVNGPYNYDFTPPSAAYSGYASPASAFSPLSQPLIDQRHQSMQFADDSFFPNQPEPTSQPYTSYPSSEVSMQVGTHNFSSADNMDPSMYSHFDWDNFATNGFADVTAPPTPDDFLPIQRPDPSFGAEESIPFHALEDSMEPGEVLVGMGLYDAPEKSPVPDPHLDNYRTTMMAQLLGSGYRKSETPLASGKGLKLEETWNPPPSDHEEDGEGDSDEDAEGSEADDSLAVTVESSIRNDIPTVQINEGVVNGDSRQDNRNGWL